MQRFLTRDSQRNFLSGLCRHHFLCNECMRDVIFVLHLLLTRDIFVQINHSVITLLNGFALTECGTTQVMYCAQSS